MTQNIEISNLKLHPDLTDSALKLYLDVFEKEAISSYQFKFKQSQTKEKLFHTLKQIVPVLMKIGYEIHLALDEQELLGVIIVKGQNDLSKWDERKLLVKQIPKIIPLLSILNIKNTLDLSKGVSHHQDLSEPYLTLVIIAVADQHQGKGVGKGLLNFVQESYRDHYTGIYLYTASEKNYQIYKHLGYDLLIKNTKSKLDIYHMFLDFE